jgi:hypothetical protein
VLADAVHCTDEPEPLAVIVLAELAAAQDGDELTADEPDLKQIHTLPDTQLLKLKLRVSP